MIAVQHAATQFNWLLREVVPLDDVLALGRHPDLDQDMADALLSSAADFIDAVIAPINHASDRVGVKLRDGRVVTPPGWREAYAQWCANGWPSLGAPAEHGGQAMPCMLQSCMASMLGGADLAFAMVAAAGRAAASVLLEHADPALASLCVGKLACGEWAATIAMTEPQAGTDVGQIRTIARRRADGRFALSGGKIFISGGDHDLTEQILHIMLARIEGAPPGVKGLSLFLVPSRQFEADGTLGAANGIAVSGIEEKMGLHGSATCSLSLDDSLGVLLGHENDGLAAMFTMMHELRLETGLSAVGIGTVATAHALAYVNERRQGRVAGRPGQALLIAHPDVQRMIAIMQSLTEAGRALLLECARQIDLMNNAPDPAVRARSAGLVSWLLPVCKAGLSDDATEVCSLGIQVRGGHGYVRESGAEQHLRDVRVLSIYEGANGVQAIDLLMRRLVRNGGAVLRDFLTLQGESVQATAGDADLHAIRAMVALGIDTLERTSAALVAAAAASEDSVLAGATAYLALVNRVAQAWMWLRMAAADQAGSERRALARFYAEYYTPELALHAARAQRGLLRAERSPLLETF